MTKTRTQTNSILSHLEKGRSLTAIQALDKFGCLRLAARINDLRNLGWNIAKESYITATGKRVAKYSLR